MCHTQDLFCTWTAPLNKYLSADRANNTNKQKNQTFFFLTRTGVCVGFSRVCVFLGELTWFIQGRGCWWNALHEPWPRANFHIWRPNVSGLSVWTYVVPLSRFVVTATSCHLSCPARLTTQTNWPKLLIPDANKALFWFCCRQRLRKPAVPVWKYDQIII